MLYLSMALNLGLMAAAGYLWVRVRDQENAAERAAREFELMMQAQLAEQRTEILQLHAMLIESRQRPGESEEASPPPS